jgi:hypothetical protein
MSVRKAISKESRKTVSATRHPFSTNKVQHEKRGQPVLAVLQDGSSDTATEYYTLLRDHNLRI